MAAKCEVGKACQWKKSCFTWPTYYVLQNCKLPRCHIKSSAILGVYLFVSSETLKKLGAIFNQIIIIMGSGHQFSIYFNIISLYYDNFMVLSQSLSGIGSGTRGFQRGQVDSNESWTLSSGSFVLHFLDLHRMRRRRGNLLVKFKV